MKHVALVLLSFAGWAAAQTAPSISVTLKPGPSLGASAGSISSQRFTALVTDEAGNPVQGATVTFILPRQAPTGRFSSGLSTESAVTASDGTVSVAGIAWQATPGAVEIRIKATWQGRSAEHEFTIDLSPGSSDAPTAIGGRSGSKKWLILAGAAAAGAAIALAGKGGSPAAPPAYSAPASTTPTIGVPAINIGKP